MTRRKARNPRRRTASAASRGRRRVVRRRNTYSTAPRRRRRTTRRRNPRITVRRNRRRVSRSRNPSLFGSRVSTAAMTEAVIGGLVGVTATKMIPAALPFNLTASPVMRIVSSLASAIAASWLAKMISPRFGDAVLFGGLMQTGSLALNTFIPSLGSQIGLSGLGELVQGSFAVPSNPLNPSQPNYPNYGRAVPAGDYGNGAPVTMNGVQRAFGRAF